ncbi:hypothetical protein ES703_109830 [subsurface metagenome]
MQDIAPCPLSGWLFHEIAVFSDVEYLDNQSCFFRCKYLLRFLKRPHIILSFNAFAVSVLSRVEPSLRLHHIPQNIGENLPCRFFVFLFSSCLIGLSVGHGQQSLIVEHLFKMWYKPSRISRVAVKPKPDMVVNATSPHLLKRFFNHLQSPLITAAPPVAQQEKQVVGSRKLGSAPKTTVLLVKPHGKLLIGKVQGGFIQGFTGCARRHLP